MTVPASLDSGLYVGWATSSRYSINGSHFPRPTMAARTVPNIFDYEHGAFKYKLCGSFLFSSWGWDRIDRMHPRDLWWDWEPPPKWPVYDGMTEGDL